MPVRTAKFWFLTTPKSLPNFPSTDALPPSISYWKGQQEIGANGLEHYQHCLVHDSKVSSAVIRRMFPGSHVELSRSAAVYAYVHKDETAVEGTRWELGVQPVNRNQPKDWHNILACAKAGDFGTIPPDVVVRSYPNLCRIALHNMLAEAVVKSIDVLYGSTGCGKSRKAWDTLGFGAYPKNPNNRFWDGYRPKEHEGVIIDEFRGNIGISELLRWCDRYPTQVETKGGGCVLLCKRIIITSNLHPREWYPQLDSETYQALLRRFSSITEFGPGKYIYDGPSTDVSADGVTLSNSELSSTESEPILVGGDGVEGEDSGDSGGSLSSVPSAVEE